MSQAFKDLLWSNSLNSSCSPDLKIAELTSTIFNTNNYMAVEEYFNMIICSAIFILHNHENVKELCTFDCMAKEQGGKPW